MPTYNMYMCKMVIPKPSKHVDTRILKMMLVVGSKYNALCMVSRFTKLFGKYSVKTQIVCIQNVYKSQLTIKDNICTRDEDHHKVGQQIKYKI